MFKEIKKFKENGSDVDAHKMDLGCSFAVVCAISLQ